MFKFLLTFLIDIITPVISSTQIVCDVMCVNMQSINFYIVCRKKSSFFYELFFL